MGIKALNIFSLKYRFQLLKYVFAVKTIDNIPEPLKKTYDLISKLENESILFFRKKRKIHFSYAIENKIFKFSVNEFSSDAMVFNQIIIKEEYKVIINLFRKFNIEPKNIIDAGANIGLTSMYFTRFFPGTLILSLEPSLSTFQDLNDNINNNQFTNIKVINKGLWNKETFLKADYSFRDEQSWAFRLVETTDLKNALFETTTVPLLIKNFNLSAIDFLKIDIEGGEKQVFSADNHDWLDLVSIISIEIHDEFNCKENIENILIKKGFEISYSGELTIGVNQRITDCQNKHSK